MAETATNSSTVAASDNSWLPISTSDLTPLAALSVCSTNVHAGCDFHNDRKKEEYLRAWAQPGPPYCRRPGAAAADEQPIHADRFGIEVPCANDM